MKKFIIGALALSLVTGVFSCKNEDEVNPIPEDVETVINSSISGVVTENGAPLAGATVKAGSETATSAEDGTFTLKAAEGEVVVTASKEGYVETSASVNVVKESVASVNFELSAKNKAVTVSPDSETTLLEERDKFTSMTFAAGAVAENTEVAITEYTTRATFDGNMGAISVLYCEPSGQTFNVPVKVNLNSKTSSDVVFANMVHYTLKDGKWVKESDIVAGENGYTCELTHFSSHAFGAAAKWSSTNSTETSEGVVIDNLGQVSATSKDVTVNVKNGWEIDGDLTAAVKAALAGVSDSDAAALAEELNRMVSNEKGSSATVKTNAVSLGSVSVSGDKKATISVENEVVSSTMAVDVVFKGQTITVNVPVKEYKGAKMKVSYQNGEMRPEHSGSNIQG